MQSARATAHVQRALVNFFNLHAYFTQLANDAITMLGVTVPDLQLTFRDCSGDNERSGFNPIGNDGVLRATECLDTFDLNRGCACPTDPCAHLIEKFGQVSDLRLARGIVDGGRAASQGGRHHQVLSSSYGNLIKAKLSAYQSAVGCARDDVTRFKKNFGAEFAKSREMQIDWTRADSASARK